MEFPVFTSKWVRETLPQPSSSIRCSARFIPSTVEYSSTPFSYLALISLLVDKEVITYAQAAYFSLVEEDIEGAYEYLENCEVEPDESLLNLYASYDLIGYFQLVDHYSKKVSYQVSGGIRWEKKCGLSSHY